MNIFYSSRLKSETLRNLTEILDADASARYSSALSCNDYREQCAVIGAFCATLEILAAKLGALRMFGASFAEDAEQLRAFCDMMRMRAYELGTLAEYDPTEKIEEAAAKVEYWLQKSAEDDARFEAMKAETIEATEEQDTETTEPETKKAEGLRHPVAALFGAMALTLSLLFCSCSEPANARRVAGDSVELVHWFCARGGINAVGVVGGDSVAFHLDTDAAKWSRSGQRYTIAADSLTVYPCHTERSAWTGNTSIITE